MFNREAFAYSERAVDPGNPTSGVYSNTTEVTPPRFYTLSTGETTLEQILERVEKLDNVVLIRFPTSAAPDACNRVLLQAHFAPVATDGDTAYEDVYGLLRAELAGKPALAVVKLFERSMVVTSVSGASVGGGAGGGGKSNGTQVPEQDTTITTTGALEAITGGAIKPEKWADGRHSGVSLADVGPFVALMRCPSTDVTGISLLHARWR